jgi:hypothetical protein
MQQQPKIGRDWLALAAIAFLAANLLHVADHGRQHLAGLNAVVLLLGTLVTASAVAVFIAVRRGSPYAPLLAAVVGFQAAIGVSASHIAPEWSVISASYSDDIHPDTLAWAVMLSEVVAGFLLGIAGLYSLRARARGGDDDAALTEGSGPAAAGPTSALQEG